MELLIAFLKKVFRVDDEGQPLISDGSTREAYREQTKTLAAGETWEVFAVFNYFRVISQAAGVSLTVRFGDNGAETPYTGTGLGVNLDDTFRRVSIKNTGTGGAVTIATALGSISDDRLNVSGTINTNITNTSVPVKSASNSISNGVVSVTTAATVLAAFDNTRTQGTFRNQGAVDLYLGINTVTTANGMLLKPDESFVYNSGAALYGIVASGTCNVGYVTERV